MNTTAEKYIASMPMLSFYVIGGFLFTITIIWLICARRNKTQLAARKEKLRNQKNAENEDFTEESLDEELEPNNWYAWVVGISICLYVWIVGAVITHVWAEYFFIHCADEDNNKALFGDSFGAVNALISAFAFAGMIVAFIMQRYELKLQRKELRMTRDEMKEQTAEFETQNAIMKKQAFEGTFFKMLEVHRQNVGNVMVDGKVHAEAFYALVTILEERYNAAEKSLEEIENHPSDPDFAEGAKVLNGLSEEERKTFCIKYAYGHLTYGADYHVNYNKGSKFRGLEKSVNCIFTNHITSTVGKGGLFKYEYFEGILGHYYRTIFQIVMFVNSQDILNFNEKYQYVKMLRSQMSDYEQILFYYNALSNMGHPWINRIVSHEDNDGQIVEYTMPYSLLIKYRMIKNIPHFFEYFYADPRKFFKEEIRNWEEEADEPFFEQLEQME